MLDGQCSYVYVKSKRLSLDKKYILDKVVFMFLFYLANYFLFYKPNKQDNTS